MTNRPIYWVAGQEIANQKLRLEVD